MPVELQPIGETLGLPASPDELHNYEEPPLAAALLPLLQHQHEEEAEAGPHHPVLHTRQADARVQELNVLPLVEWHSIPGFSQVW